MIMEVPKKHQNKNKTIFCCMIIYRNMPMLKGILKSNGKNDYFLPILTHFLPFLQSNYTISHIDA